MHISINTDEGLSDLDKQILAVLAGGAVTPAPAAKQGTGTAKKTTAAKPAPEKVEEPADEPDETAGDDDSAGDEPEVSLADAKALATKMVANGEAAKVKTALGKVGAKKVSEVAEDDVAKFVAALG